MAFTYGFYNSKSGDRKYDATQFSKLFDGIINDGIFQSIGDAMKPTPGGGMTVNIGTGRAWFDHSWSLNDTAYPIILDPSEVVQDRIDTLVIDIYSHVDSRVNSYQYIKGTPSGDSPVAPELIFEDEHKQYRLCDVYVRQGATQITKDDITPYVGTDKCPYVKAVYDEVLDEVIEALDKMQETVDEVEEKINNLKIPTIQQTLEIGDMMTTGQTIVDDTIYLATGEFYQPSELSDLFEKIDYKHGGSKEIYKNPVIQLDLGERSTLFTIAYSEERKCWLAGGNASGDNPTQTTAVIYKSTDKKNWTRAWIETTSGAYNDTVKKIVWDHIRKQWVMLQFAGSRSQSIIRTSTDEVNWTIRYTSSAASYIVLWDLIISQKTGYMMAIGQTALEPNVRGYSVHATNGISWTATQDNNLYGIQSVACIDDLDLWVFSGQETSNNRQARIVTASFAVPQTRTVKYTGSKNGEQVYSSIYHKHLSTLFIYASGSIFTSIDGAIFSVTSYSGSSYQNHIYIEDINLIISACRTRRFIDNPVRFYTPLDISTNGMSFTLINDIKDVTLIGSVESVGYDMVYDVETKTLLIVSGTPGYKNSGAVPNGSINRGHLYIVNDAFALPSYNDMFPNTYIKAKENI